MTGDTPISAGFGGGRRFIGVSAPQVECVDGAVLHFESEDAVCHTSHPFVDDRLTVFHPNLIGPGGFAVFVQDEDFSRRHANNRCPNALHPNIIRRALLAERRRSVFGLTPEDQVTLGIIEPDPTMDGIVQVHQAETDVLGQELVEHVLSTIADGLDPRGPTIELHQGRGHDVPESSHDTAESVLSELIPAPDREIETGRRSSGGSECERQARDQTDDGFVHSFSPYFPYCFC